MDCGLSRVRRGSGIFFAGFADRVCRWSYTVQYEQPIKAPIHRSIKFVIEKDRLILLDADGKERSAHIDKRERVLQDSPDRPRR